MLKNENIICISSIDWDFIWQQHQAIMSRLAANNNRILFIENTGVRPPGIGDIARLKKRIINWNKSVKGFRKERENLYVYSPLILPFPYFRFARWINRFLFFKALTRWLNVMDFKNPIIWTFLPTPIVLDLEGAIPHKAFIYYCTDNFAATSKSARRIVKYEKMVLQKADAVFVMAKNMLDYCLSFNKNVTRIPMGVDTEVFRKPEASMLRPADIGTEDKRIVGYIGGIRRSIDQDLVVYLAKKFPDYIFLFIGPVQTDISAMRSFKNIVFLGQKPHEQLPAYIKQFCACIVPYRKDDYTDNVSLAKLNEYLIMGKPVISTNLKELESFDRESGDVIYIADNYDDFAKFLEKAIDEDNRLLEQKRIKVAENNSWDKKVEQMSEIIEITIKSGESTAINWQVKFLKIYKTVRRKVIIFLSLLAALYLLLFYTPLLWLVGAPLKFSQNPQKADALVVFAGGVGESGLAGQGYEERVKYAVELYKKGYASHIIFSSGYMHTFREPVVMRALALSMGVPDEAIILEDKAKNTYENVEFTSQILASKNWGNILLISSPYHMRRARLVFEKNAPELDVIYTPAPDSQFYNRKFIIRGKKSLRQASLRQIEGILHEYLSIIYYWWKGYV